MIKRFKHPKKGFVEQEVLNGHTVSFVEDTHEYYVDNLLVPSVTSIIQYMFDNQYQFVKESILQRARILGEKFHKEVELFEKSNVDSGSSELYSYKELKKKHSIEYLDGERFIYIMKNDVPIAAGRFDILANVNSEKAIVELKRTSKIYYNRYSLQLNLYRIGYEQTYNDEIRKLFCLRAKDNQKEFKEIPVLEDDTWLFLERFLETSIK